jgi:hypothetical protein
VRNLKPIPKLAVGRGRAFSRYELQAMRAISRTFWKEGRTRISVEICRALNWRQPNGWLKDRACRDVLRSFATQRLLNLPRKRTKRHKKNGQTLRIRHPTSIGHQEKQATLHSVNGPIRFELAKGNSAEREWNALVQKHHYLGHKVTVGIRRRRTSPWHP